MGTNKKKSIFFFTDKNSYFFVLFCFRNEKVFDDDDDNHTSMMLDLALVWYVAIGFVCLDDKKKFSFLTYGHIWFLYEKTFVQSLFLFIYFVCIFSRMIEFSEKKKNFLHSLFRWMTFEEFSLFSFDEKTKVTCLCVCGCQICKSLFVSRFRRNFAKNNDFVVWFFLLFLSLLSLIN